MAVKTRLAILLEQALLLPELQRRKVGSLLGAAVGDAAARPLHWVYGLGDLNSYIRSNPDNPEFWPESKSPFYTLPTGDNSCYWDEAMAVMTSLNNRREFDFENICKEFTVQFGSTSPYNKEAREEYMYLRRMRKIEGPIVGKWLHGGMIKFLENFADNKKICGDPHIKETDGFCCSLPVVAKYAGSENLLVMVERVTSTQSTWPVAVRHAMVGAKIVEAFILNRSPDSDPFETVKHNIRSQYPEILEELEDIESLSTVGHTEAVAHIFGQPCYNPGSFMGAIHAMQTSDTFTEAIRKTIKAGGCNCSRSFFIGAMLGAKLGVEGIPVDWIQKTKNAETILDIAMKITA